MRTSSAKSKGRRLVQALRNTLLETFPTMQPDDLVVTPSGVTGEDLRMSPFARLMVPFSFEAKNVERINIWDAIKQSRLHTMKTKAWPAVVFSRNREPEPWVAIPMSVFAKLLRDHSKELQSAVHTINNLPPA